MKSRRIEWEGTGDGWVTVRDPDVPLGLAIRPARLEGRVVIGALKVSAGEGVRTSALKALRLQRYEVAMNRPGIGDLVQGVLDRDPLVERVIRRGTQTVRKFNLAVPERPPYGDRFYREVADFYLAMLEAGRAPAPELAAATCRPVSTARRWVVECRRRGFLPPGMKGKAG